MWSLTAAAFASSELAGLLCRVIAFDERTMRGRVHAQRVLKKWRTPDTIVVVGLVGIQTNMFPRARELALEFKAAGAGVRMGGFPNNRSIPNLLYVAGHPHRPRPLLPSPPIAQPLHTSARAFS